MVVGGSGLYIKALTHGLNAAPSADPVLRAQLNELTSDQLREKLVDLDPETARKIDMKNRRRVVRALEISLLAGAPVSGQRMQAVAGVVKPGRPRSTPLNGAAAKGIFVFRNREELHKRINQRVEAMFENDVIGEVRAIDEIGATAAKMIGLREIREHLEGKMSILQCMEKIQGATRQYAKRQLTWFRHQTSFEPLNLSLLTHKEAIERISQRASLLGRAKG
jgi:tRNA dimethylallyltransferase